MKLMRNWKLGATTFIFCAGLNCLPNVAHAQTAVATATPAVAATSSKSALDDFESVYFGDIDITDLFDDFFKTKTLLELDNAVAALPKDAKVYNKRGDHFYRKNQYDKALADYRKAASLDAANARSHTGMAGVYKAQKNFVKALSEYEKAAALEPKSIWHHIGMAELYAEQNNVAKALAEYGIAVVLDAPSTYALRMRGDYFMKLGRDAEALADYNKAVMLQPTNTSTYLDRARFFRSRNQLDKALLDYNKMVEIGPKTVFHLQQWQGELLNEMKRYQDAIGSFTKALAIEPKNAEALDGLGIAYTGTASYQLAIDSFDEAIALAPYVATYYANRGLTHVKLKAWTAAQTDLDRSIALNPKLGTPYLYRALLTLEQEKTSTLPAKARDSAILDIVQALQLDATLVDSVYDFADEYSKSFLYRGKGIALMMGVVQALPRDVNAPIKLGDLQVANYQSADAVVSYTRALQIDAKSTSALSGRAKAYFGKAKPYNDAGFALAVADWKSYLVLKPNDIDAMQQMGIGQYNALQTADGISTFRKLVKTNNGNAYAHLMLGLGSAIQGDKTAATTEVKTYISKATPDEVSQAKSNFGNAKTHYPTNEVLKTMYDLIPSKTQTTDDDEDPIYYV